MSEETPRRIPDWLHLVLSLLLSVLALLLVYAIVFVVSDLVSKHVFALNLKDQWIGIVSISLAFLITYSWIRRMRVKTEPVAWKRNLRWSSNLILLVFLAFIAFVAYRVYSQDLDLPQMEQYLPHEMGTTPADSSQVDSLQATEYPADSL